jgi:hypothetical protein
MRHLRAPRARTRLIVAAAAVAALALAVSACGVSGDDSTPAGSLADMLGEVPDTPGNRSSVVWVDVAAAREHAGLPADGKEALKVFGADAGSSAVQAMPPLFMDNRAAQLDEWRTEVGFTANDIDQSIDVGAPPATSAVVRGRIEVDEVEQAVSSDPLWKDDRETAEHHGVEYWRWLDDDEVSVERVSATRSLGNSLRLQAEDGQVRWARTDEAMHGSIDAGAGDTDSLADVDELVRLAAALDDHDAYQAFLSADPGPFSVDRMPRATPEVKERAGKGALEPWTAVAAGDAVDGDTAIGVLVLTHADDDAAKTNVERLRELLESGRSPERETAYSDDFEVRSIDQDGSTVVLTVEQERPRLLFDEVVVLRSLVRHR